MREFRLKPFKLKTAQEADRNGLTEEQHKAMNAEFVRRIATFREKWRGCRVGRCRRGRQCCGSPTVCLESWARWTNREYRRLRRDVVRRPVRIPRA